MAGRGANGRSTIVKQRDGRWHGFVSMGAKGDGTSDRRHVSATSRAAAVEKVKELEAKRDAGVVSLTSKPLLLEEWLDYWVDNIASVRVRARTLNTYRSMIRMHLKP
jgi:integrase